MELSCFEKMDKIDKALATQTKKEKIQIPKIRNERGYIKTDATEIKTHETTTIMHQVNNLEDKFLETYTLPFKTKS